MNDTADDNLIALDDDSLFQVRENRIACELDGDTVILNLDSGVYYGLNAVGSRIWALIQEDHSLGAMRERLLQEYELDPQRCESDLRALLDSLLEADLVELRNAG